MDNNGDGQPRHGRGGIGGGMRKLRRLMGVSGGSVLRYKELEYCIQLDQHVNMTILTRARWENAGAWLMQSIVQ